MNKKRLLVIIICLTVLLIGGIYFLTNGKKYDSLIIDDSEWNNIVENKLQSNSISIENIKFNDYSALIDEENSIIYYSMIDMSNKLNPVIKYSSNKNKTSIAFNEEIIEEKIKNNNNFKVIIYDDTKYHEYDLVVTSLPILNITYDNETVKEKRIPIDIYLFDNRNNAHKRVLNSKGELNIIDNSDKKDYSFSLLFDSLGRNERENNVSILGMQNHSEYILNSLSNDNEKIRNVFITNIWNDMSIEKNDNSEYVELFINNQYVGLYSLGYNIEKESLMMGRDDILFFKNSLIDSEKEYDKEGKLDGYTIYNKVLQNQVKKDKDKKDCNGENCLKSDPWKELENYYKNILSDNAEDIKKVSNLENAADIYLLYLFSQATDNVDEVTFANTYLAFKRNKDNFIVEFIPWSMNNTFGNNIKKTSISSDNNNYVMNYNPVTRLLELNDEETIKLVKEKYKKLRDNILSEERINKLLEKYENSIVNSGAYLRDNEKWNNSETDISEKLTEFNNYVIERLKSMDEYIENL